MRELESPGAPEVPSATRSAPRARQSLAFGIASGPPAEMFDFCTYFDKHYLHRGLALYQSLRRHCPDFRLWVLCMDDATLEVLGKLALPGIEAISLQEFERGDEPLLRAKENRSRIEYYFTCTPSLPLYVLNRSPSVDLITYLDADLFFYSDPTPLFRELGPGSVALIGHRFPPHIRHQEVFGVYNVGWLSFRRDAHAFQCLRSWRAQCLEWCYDRAEDGRCADQKYLDDWTTRFQNVVVLEHRGANVAPWNLANHPVRAAGTTGVVVGNHPLIFFHFHGLNRIGWRLYNSGLSQYGDSVSNVLRSRVLLPYLRALQDVHREYLRGASCQIEPDSIRVSTQSTEQRESLAGLAIRWLRNAVAIAQTILRRGYAFAPR